MRAPMSVHMYTLDEHFNEYYYNAPLLVCVRICLVLCAGPYLHVAIIAQLQCKGRVWRMRLALA